MVMYFNNIFEFGDALSMRSMIHISMQMIPINLNKYPNNNRNNNNINNTNKESGNTLSNF